MSLHVLTCLPQITCTMLWSPFQRNTLGEFEVLGLCILVCNHFCTSTVAEIWHLFELGNDKLAVNKWGICHHCSVELLKWTLIWKIVENVNIMTVISRLCGDAKPGVCVYVNRSFISYWSRNIVIRPVWCSLGGAEHLAVTQPSAYNRRDLSVKQTVCFS